MFNAVHLLETAVLMLAAFLLGASAGAGARLLLRSGMPASDVARSVQPVAPAVRQEQAAREVEDAATGQSEIASPAPVVPLAAAGPVMAPARVAGQTTSGIPVRSPGQPINEAPPSAMPDAAPPSPVVDEQMVSALLASALLQTPEEPPPASADARVAMEEPAEDPVDDEAAAMRAIEGSWTPGRRAATASGSTVVLDPQPDLAAASQPGSEMLPPAPAINSGDAVEAAAAPEPAAESPGRPWGLAAPRQDKPDNLTNIIGVLPVIETSLNRLGIFHFDQVGALSDENVVWIEAHLGIDGRIAREHWREQARELSQFVTVQQNAAQ